MKRTFRKNAGALWPALSAFTGNATRPDLPAAIWRRPCIADADV
jgi:hypothetical protein